MDPIKIIDFKFRIYLMAVKKSILFLINTLTKLFM